MLEYELWNAFKRGLRQGARGYFAPLHPSPWKAAWNAAKQRDATWTSPFVAWFSEVERLVRGDTK